MERQEYRVTKAQARRFLLMKQGLWGEYIFAGKPGAFAYVRQAGCIQFDPVDACGRNAELTLQSRVKGFRKRDLYDLLYRDRALVDYTDKELSIFPAEDWPYFERSRTLCRENGARFEGLAELEEEALRYIGAHGPVSSATLPIEGEIVWHSSIHWSGNWQGRSGAARSVLEQLYSTGVLILHHKEGTRKVYDLAERHLDARLLSAPDPLPDDAAHRSWRVLRRVGAVGLLWDRNSTAFLGIPGLGTEERHAAFETLLDAGRIVPASVEGISFTLYLRAEDAPLLEAAMGETGESTRCEFLAPLDPMLWDRRLIEKLFDFTYSWEIYTPREKRRYGYYVLPLLYGDRLAGRIEPVIEDGVLRVRGLWLEQGVRPTKKLEQAITRRLRRFARFNDCNYEERPLFER